MDEPIQPPATDEPVSEPDTASLNSLVLSLTIGALQQLGVDPSGKETGTQANPEYAKHAIDLLEMLKLKTHGNTTSDEEDLMSAVLLDLRLRYLKLVQEKESAKPETTAETPKPPEGPEPQPTGA